MALIQKYSAAIRGNVAMMFGICLLAIIVVVGVAVDYTGASGRKQVMQNFSDAAVLAAASSGKETHGELQAIAQKVVDENNTTGQSLTTQLEILEDMSLRVTVAGQYDTNIMGIFGRPLLDVKVVSEAPPQGGLGLMDVALVLDVTESMEGSKVAALKTAAGKLIDTFEAEAEPGDVRVSVVPFAQYVKIPTSYRSQSWIDVQADENYCYNPVDWDASTNCREEATDWSSDGVAKSGTRTVCDTYVYETEEVCGTNTWEGCMGSRSSPWYSREQYGSSKLRGFSTGGWCHSEMLPLTDNLTSVRTRINTVDTNQETYIPSGLIWGWRALTPGAPLTEANTADNDARQKVLVLMTDGENTKSIDLDANNKGFAGHYHWDSDEAHADNLTKDLCRSINDDEITVYAIAFEVSDSQTKKMLKDCASEADKYFDASSEAQLIESFEDIGRDLSLVRLSR